MHKGIDKGEQENFKYLRIDTELNESCNIEMDETDTERLKKLAEKATIEFQNNATNIIKSFGNGSRWTDSQRTV